MFTKELSFVVFHHTKWSNVKVKIGLNHYNSKNFTFRVFVINSKLDVKVPYSLPLNWLILLANQPWVLSAEFNFGGPKSQILRSTEPYRVASHMKAFDEWFFSLRPVTSSMPWRNLIMQYKMHLFNPWVNVYLNVEVLLQDAVRHVGDMVH